MKKLNINCVLIVTVVIILIILGINYYLNIKPERACLNGILSNDGKVCVINDPSFLSRNPNFLDICYYHYDNYCNYTFYYDIKYVDGFYTDSCYAFNNTKKSEVEKEEIIRSFESFRPNIISAQEYFNSKNIVCKEIKERGNAHCSKGEIYCLNNKSQCLQVEGNICNLINL